MDLSGIELPASVIAALYPSSLVEAGGSTPVISNIAPSVDKKVPLETETPAPVATKKEKQKAELVTPLKYLGENQKNILVVVDYPAVSFIPDEELNFLTKMLGACQLTLGDVALINQAHTAGIPLKEKLQQLHPQLVFLFGVDPLSFGLPVSFPHYQIQAVSAVKYLYTPALEQRHQDELLKSKLWVSLRQIFGI